MTPTFARATLMVTVGLISLAAIPLPAQTPAEQQSPPTAASPSGAPVAASDAQVPTDQRPPTPIAGTAIGKPANGKAAKKGGKKEKPKKEKKPKLVHVKIERGTLTVDGYVGKAALNYDIADLHYLYMYLPSSGTVVVARDKFVGATEQKDGFHGNALTVTADGHVVELVSELQLLSKKPESAWVKLDPAYKLPSKYPVFGFGDTVAAPYSWPGALQMGQEKGVAAAPPLPKSVLPTLAPKPVPVKLSTSPAKATPPATPPPSPAGTANPSPPR